MRDSLLLTFLYRTVPGRMVLKLLTRQEVSRAAGWLLSSKISKIAVPWFVRDHHIDLSDVDVPKGGFSSFNDFFTRKRSKESHEGAMGVISPCDGYLSVVPVKKETVFAVKHTWFSLEDLLKDKELGEKFYDGLVLIFRLTPADYHRYCYAADGKVYRHKKISGELHCVRPVALREFPVFARNSREYQVIHTEKYGTMIQMEIGAMLVGKIKNHRRFFGISPVRAGEEKGYFEFGGSTILLLFQKDAISFCRELYGRRNENGEIPVKKGECVAKEISEKK